METKRQENENFIKPKTKKRIKYGNVMFICIGIVLAVHLFSLLVPFIWMLTVSLKKPLEYDKTFLSLPQGGLSSWQWENYAQVFTNFKIYVNGKPVYIETMLWNSMILAIFKPFFSMLGMVLCSYIVAKYDFKGKKFLFNLNIFVMIIPIVGSLANQLIVYKQLGILNNLVNYIILPAQPFGFNFLLLYGVFKAIPDSYAEAVTVDGGGHWTIFTRIYLPLAMPTIFTLYILGFIGVWNDYNASLLYIQKVPNIAYGLYKYQYDSVKEVGLPKVLATFVVCSIPSVVLFAASQKVITKSLNVGGLKG